MQHPALTKLSPLPQQYYQDPRIKSKCATPIPPPKDQNKKCQEMLSGKKTQQKQIKYLTKNHKQSNCNQQLDQQLNKKIQNYRVISRTLKQYFKLQKLNNNNKYQLLYTAIQVIKAFTKAQIMQINPKITQLIHKILDTLPLKPSKSKKTNKKTKYNENIPNIISQYDEDEQNIVMEQKWEKLRKAQEIYTHSELKKLENNLQDLRNKGQQLEKIKMQFQQMTEQQKTVYISQLQQIIIQQKQIIELLSIQN